MHVPVPQYREFCRVIDIYVAELRFGPVVTHMDNTKHPKINNIGLKEHSVLCTDLFFVFLCFC